MKTLPFSPSRAASQWLLSAATTGLMLFGGTIVLGPQLLAPPVAHAQTVTNEEITNYAEAVLAMDVGRQDAYAQISDIMTSAGLDVSQYTLTCPNAQTLSDVPRPVRPRVSAILVEYCNNARTIVEDSGLTVRRFNAITEAHRNDSDLAQRIRDEISTLQL
ncbi:MAG: DUF4168 domain-containing protein [Cyanobacteria bacterium J06626_23]